VVQALLVRRRALQEALGSAGATREGGEDYHLPADRDPSTANCELHRLLADQFWGEVPKDFASVLDVGCADGSMVRAFKEAGKSAVGIDTLFYPTDRLYFEEQGLEIFDMDMHAMTFPDERFDAVWCRHVLEHSFSPLQVLAEIHRVLTPEGYVFVALPPVGVEPYPGHWHVIPEHHLRYLLELCNFEVLATKTVAFSHRAPNDNAEIRAIARKIAGAEPRAGLPRRVGRRLVRTCGGLLRAVRER
jgi:SAM-dependent methyltransferase